MGKRSGGTTNMATGEFEQNRAFRPWIAYFRDAPERDRRVVGRTPEDAAANFVKAFVDYYDGQHEVHVVALDQEGGVKTVWRVWVEWKPVSLTKARLQKARTK